MTVSILNGQNALRHVVEEKKLGMSRFKQKSVAKPVKKLTRRQIAIHKSAQVSNPLGKDLLDMCT